MKIKCPSCSAVLNVPDTAAGKIVKCPCGKQLRAPGAAATPAAQQPTAQKPAAAPQQRPPTRQPSAQQSSAKRATPQRPGIQRQPIAPATPQQAGGAGFTGFEGGLFDELTEGDLQPVTAVAQPGVKKKQQSTGGKLLQQYDDGKSKSPSQPLRFSVGPLASPGVRLGASIIDGLVIAFLVIPIFFVAFIVIAPLLVDAGSLDNIDQMSEQQRATFSMEFILDFMAAYLVAITIAHLLPIVLFAFMLTKYGQSPGKKMCGLRIVDEETKAIPNFVRIVLIRSWLKNLAWAIPFVGLVDVLMIFSEDRKCGHDRMAGTIVVESK